MELKMKDLSNLILRLSLLFSLCFCSGVEGMQKVLKNPNNTMTRKIEVQTNEKQISFGRFPNENKEVSKTEDKKVHRSSSYSFSNGGNMDSCLRATTKPDKMSNDSLAGRKSNSGRPKGWWEAVPWALKNRDLLDTRGESARSVLMIFGRHIPDAANISERPHLSDNENSDDEKTDVRAEHIGNVQATELMMLGDVLKCDKYLTPKSRRNEATVQLITYNIRARGEPCDIRILDALRELDTKLEAKSESDLLGNTEFKKAQKNPAYRPVNSKGEIGESVYDLLGRMYPTLNREAEELLEEKKKCPIIFTCWNRMSGNCLVRDSLGCFELPAQNWKNGGMILARLYPDSHSIEFFRHPESGLPYTFSPGELTRFILAHPNFERTIRFSEKLDGILQSNNSNSKEEKSEEVGGRGPFLPSLMGGDVHANVFWMPRALSPGFSSI
ncbi:MAG: hypothetical protein IJA14_03635 [Alphaproteobacteria bacterium]|nr:hypothetical protein [Alphaproteobacteria bacterium]